MLFGLVLFFIEVLMYQLWISPEKLMCNLFLNKTCVRKLLLRNKARIVLR
jgi:hypothetical protein